MPKWTSSKRTSNGQNSGWLTTKDINLLKNPICRHLRQKLWKLSNAVIAQSSSPPPIIEDVMKLSTPINVHLVSFQFQVFRLPVFERLQLKTILACKLCPRTFKRNGDLKGHMKSHAWDESYNCPICDEKFPSSFSRLRHIRKHSQRGDCTMVSNHSTFLTKMRST